MINEESKLTDETTQCEIVESEEVTDDKELLSINSLETIKEVIATPPPKEDKLLQELTTIRELLEERLFKLISRDKAFEKLYEELDDLKRNRAFEENRSIFLDLVLLIDRITAASQEPSVDDNGILISIQEELIEILDRRDITVMKENSLAFDPRYQKAIRTENVFDESLNNTIVEVLRPGYMFREIVLRPQEVIVGRYTLI